jgi:hypothetical protein
MENSHICLYVYVYLCMCVVYVGVAQHFQVIVCKTRIFVCMYVCLALSNKCIKPHLLN